MKKLVTVGPKNTNGYRKHLEELTNIYSGPSKYVIISKENISEIDKIIKEKPDLTIIGARRWVRRNIEIFKKLPGKKALLYVGPLGQEEISQENIDHLIFYLKLLDQNYYDYLFVGSKHLANALERKDVIHLPAPSITDLKNNYTKIYLKENTVGVLHDKAPHKNTLNSICGIANSSKKIKFITKDLSDNQKYLTKCFGIKNVIDKKGIIPEKEYNSIIDECKLLLHISYSEGFCYSVAEAMMRGTPVLITSAMPWFYHPLLHVNELGNPVEIAKRIDNVLSLNEKDYKTLSKEVQLIAQRAIEKNNKLAKKALDSILK